MSRFFMVHCIESLAYSDSVTRMVMMVTSVHGLFWERYTFVEKWWLFSHSNIFAFKL